MLAVRPLAVAKLKNIFLPEIERFPLTASGEALMPRHRVLPAGISFRHRKDALFFKSRRAAAVGDLYLRLIHSCELAGGNPFEHLTEQQRHASDVAAAPGDSMD